MLYFENSSKNHNPIQSRNTLPCLKFETPKDSRIHTVGMYESHIICTNSEFIESLIHAILDVQIKGGWSMKWNLAQNIRRFRKERKLTQERLAEVMGVTMGAVYKWESGQSVPELNLIVELADFFDVSTDVLIGYEWQSSSANKTLTTLKQFRKDHQYEEGITAANKALRNYPNHFAIVYESAQLFYEKANLQKSSFDYETALNQLERACELIAQNADESISELSIRNQMAQIHFMLGRTDVCLKILKQYNFCGINNARIGCLLADSYHQTEEARGYLMKSFDKLIDDLNSVVVGFTTVFWMEKDYTSIIAGVEWLRMLLRGQSLCNQTVWFDKYDCVLLAIEAEAYCMTENQSDAKIKLMEALKLAQRFDSTEDIQNSQLLQKLGAKENYYRSYGETALEATERRVMTDAEVVPQLLVLWEQVKAEVLNQ